MADDSETGDPNAIGVAFSEPRYRDNRKNMDCEVVKVLGTSGAKEKVVSVQGLLILEKDNGIAEKVGKACLSLKRIRGLPWKRRLIPLKYGAGLVEKQASGMSSKVLLQL
ncbi:hypothetical protein MMC27_006660 [Xylographa pallens]|nr:hypothetical protein [Xylographa pallens]